MQELIDYMYQLNTQPYVNGTTFREGAINYAKKLLEKEKEQITDAYSKGYMIGEELDMLKPSIEMADKYYNQTYNQNK